MIRKFILGHRLQSAAAGSHQFMSQCNYLGERIEAPRFHSSPVARSGPSSAQLKELLKARRARANFFGPHLFADPAWDILLLSYVALLDQDPLLISRLLKTSLVPATTMLRWIKALEQEGWLERSKDPPEAPQSILKLSAAGKSAMERYLASVWPSLPL